MQKLLLHSCCAPCSSHVIETLFPDYEITIFYYNPNILPEEEYFLRESEQRRFLKMYQEKTGRLVNYIGGKYEPDVFMGIAEGRQNDREGGARCFDCIEFRMKKTAEIAKKEGFDIFCTTLTVSPHKNAAKINEIGTNLSAEYGINYLISDFKKKDGYKHSIQMSKDYGLYRQNYCGCGFFPIFDKKI